MNNKIISNQKGISLITHLKSVQKISLLMCKKLGINDSEIISAISKAALLHDIGKVYTGFQEYIKNKSESEEYITNHLLHNEISWAIIRCFMSPDNRLENSVLYSIYWHHSQDGNLGSKEFASNILEMINDNDKHLIIDLYNSLTGNSKKISDLSTSLINDKIPEYYINKKDAQNSLNFLVMSCLVSADRLVSSNDQERILTDDDYCNEILNKVDSINSKEYIIPQDINFSLDRFNYQLNCVNEISKAKTTCEIKAPAGFGKTILGILSWVKTSNKKLIWVCPRNVIAEALFDSIIKELNLLNINTSVELYLTGKRKKIYNCIDENDFSAEIIITNIDNFEKPSINNSIRNRLYQLLSSFVIFDEFHELIGSEPLFACFINIMQARHRYTNSKTLLMSATPSIITKLWDTISNQTLILPNKESHYNAAHDKKYKINLLNGINLVKPKNNHIIFTNAISSSQKLTINENFSLISHSKYVPNDRKILMDDLFNRYGKNKPIDDKLDTISAPVIQAAMDLSFGGMTEIPKSIEDTFQRLGRNGRWGEYDLLDFNIVTNINNIDIQKREDAAIRTTYSQDLNKLWVNYLNVNIKKGYEYTLNELYMIYNDFNIKYAKDINNYINSKYTESLLSLSKLFPEKSLNYHSIDKSFSKIKKGGLRDNGIDKIYCIYPLYQKENEFSDPFQVEDNGDISNNEDSGTQNFQLKMLKKLLKDERFEYNKYALFKNTKFTSDKLKLYAKNEKTPYICFHKVYHPKLGLIDKKLLYKL